MAENSDISFVIILVPCRVLRNSKLPLAWPSASFLQLEQVRSGGKNDNDPGWSSRSSYVRHSVDQFVLVSGSL
jgi:hypothetical protein